MEQWPIRVGWEVRHSRSKACLHLCSLIEAPQLMVSEFWVKKYENRMRWLDVRRDKYVPKVDVLVLWDLSKVYLELTLSGRNIYICFLLMLTFWECLRVLIYRVGVSLLYISITWECQEKMRWFICELNKEMVKTVSQICGTVRLSLHDKIHRHCINMLWSLNVLAFCHLKVSCLYLSGW